MAVKHTILFKKIAASFLLLMLFAVTAIKVLHFHSSGIVSAKNVQPGENSFSDYTKSVADTKCFICDYKLTKDADENFALFYIIHPVEFNNPSTKPCVFIIQSTNAVFETRGPPSA